MIAMHLQRYRSRISKVMASYQPASSRVRKPPRIEVLSITTFCARRLIFLIASINKKFHKIVLDTGPTRNTSGKAWEWSQATGSLLSISNRNMKRSGIERWNHSRNRIWFSLEWPSAQVRTILKFASWTKEDQEYPRQGIKEIWVLYKQWLYQWFWFLPI